MPQSPPLPALRAFEAVSRLGSVVQAADELCVTHGAVSHQLRALEDFLGVPLFTRQGKRLTLNDEGRVYAMQVRNALAEIDEATQWVQAGPRPNELVIAVIPAFASHWLLPRLPDFQARFPEYRVRLRANLAVDDLRGGLIDVAIRMGNGQWPDLKQEFLFKDHLVAVAAPNFNGGDLPQTPQAILGSTILRSVENWRPWFQAAGIGAAEPDGLHCNDSNLLIEAVKLEQGVAMTRLSLVAGLLQRGELVQLTDLVVPYPNRGYWLAWPGRTDGTRKLKDFSGWLSTQVAQYAACPASVLRGFDLDADKKIPASPRNTS
ncbi:LysR family glycine cleavage system transcriptional activator [Silvimonas terrae]|uniref:LysR family glycine cleavage system transcriptional activator n=1 Tax=Silvimonas terrae TaxID=300266 RepID=A0A840RIG6_9NEIS|nr:LysR substrate-binding domain-containing protein [Silvimonas terrae]MBB5193479.1 LysR family glycine cleavage system transcriptional activator [Silvimonas terrae]